MYKKYYLSNEWKVIYNVEIKILFLKNIWYFNSVIFEIWYHSFLLSQGHCDGLYDPVFDKVLGGQDKGDEVG